MNTRFVGDEEEVEAWLKSAGIDLPKEHAAKLPTVKPEDAIQWLDDWADFWVTSLAEDATKAVKARILEGLRNGSGVQNVMKEVSNALAPFAGDPEQVQDPEQLTPARLETIVRTNDTKAFNQGRLVAAREAGDLVVALRWDSILDTRTTEVCRHLDGKLFRPDSPELDVLSPPAHYNCRSILSPLVVGDPEAEDVEFITPEEVGQAKALAGEGFGGEYVQNFAFDPDQPRDEEGQWTSGGGTTKIGGNATSSYSEALGPRIESVRSKMPAGAAARVGSFSVLALKSGDDPLGSQFDMDAKVWAMWVPSFRKLVFNEKATGKMTSDQFDGLVGHELGHALDQALGRPAGFGDVWRGEVAALSPNSRRMLRYFADVKAMDRSAVKETIAEAYGRILTGKSSWPKHISDRFDQSFPKTIALMKRHLESFG